jgi:hypothetical protein
METAFLPGSDGTYAVFVYIFELDGRGIEIASAIIIGYGAEQWRMGVDDYLAAPKGSALKRPPLATPWCPELAEAMRRERRAVHEESVANLLLADLAAHSQ